MVGRGEVTDTAWTTLEPLRPTNGGRGQQWRDHRQVLNGILWKLRTGAPWRDLPDRYGPSMPASCGGSRMEPGTVCSRTSRPNRMRSGTSAGRSVLTAAWSGPTSMQRGPEKRGPGGIRRGDRAEPGRADNQTPPRLRWTGATAGRGADAGAAARPHPARTGARCDSGPAPHRSRPAAQAPGSPDRRQGRPLRPVSTGAASARDPAHHSGTVRSAGATGSPARPQAVVLPGHLPAAQRHPAVHQSTHAVARDCDPLRQTGSPLPSHDCGGGTDDLARSMIRQTRPSSSLEEKSMSDTQEVRIFRIALIVLRTAAVASCEDPNRCPANSASWATNVAAVWVGTCPFGSINSKAISFGESVVGKR